MTSRVLLFVERSGVIREAFRAVGADAWSCDLEAAEDGSPHHLQCDIFEALKQEWRGFVVHPECRYLSSSGLHWNKRRPGREQLTEAAVAFALACWRAGVPHVCLENPIGRLSRFMGKATQIVQPYQFGEDASKATCFWLRGLPPLRPTGFVEPRLVDGRPRWGNQTDGGQNKLAPSKHRSMDRARTYPGIARAMASQWWGIIDGK